ncbi:EAL domain-containing protein [Psychromonas sp. RZ22]|uniref:EAL domain-containing protein n=1 Tax=Psychromonas algarum TaxID=2555643 RepID=UPI001067DA6C|nr:EAL domain-containing protein [Psychromonas sp. RZ22]TEW56745.1 EAL domain-containing protein [Psychromonas sp. RZ22]
MKFTNKFTFITSAIVLTCIVLILAGGVVSLRALAFKYHQQRIDSVIHIIESQIEKQTKVTEFDHWLPDVLDASGIVRLEVIHNDVTVYKSYYESRQYYPSDSLLRYSHELEHYPGVELVLHTRQPFSDIKFTFWPLAGVSIAIFLSLSLLWFALRWIKRSFHGAELLERRARYLLQNNPTARFAQQGEWPKAVSKALDVLSERLENSRKERSVFDTHIRGQAFLDEGTGLGNRLAFENRLDAVAMDENFSSNTLMLISLTELSNVKYQFGVAEEEKMIQQMVDILRNFCERYNDSFYGRTQKSEFVIILPQMSYAETEVAAKQLTKLLYQLQLPEESLIENFFHVGVVNFPFGSKPMHIIDDVNRSLLVAEHQKVSGWHLSDEDLKHTVIIKGTVRWRALLTDVLEKQALLIYRQHVIQRDAMTILYSELWPRIKGYQQEIIAAGTFMPMAEKCGLSDQIDRQMLEKILALLIMRGEVSEPIAVNLGSHLLMNKENHKWFMFELMQQSRQIRHNLVIEVSEHLIEKDYFSLRSALIALQKIGCKIAIDNVGKSVVNTEYILDFNIDYLKLHASLIRDIHMRKTNQVAIQSLMASCLNSHAKVIAVGIETDLEWDCLLQLGIYAGQGSIFSTPQQMNI